MGLGKCAYTIAEEFSRLLSRGTVLVQDARTVLSVDFLRARLGSFLRLAFANANLKDAFLFL
jgi:hypothetical protein